MTQTNDPPLVASVALIPDSDEKADLDAPSDESGKLVVSQAPNITITSTTVVADQAERLALDPQEGDIAIQQDTTESFIFTGGANELANWQLVQFDAVGGIAGEDIAPRDIDGRNVTLTDLTVNGLLNGADTSVAAAGEALTSDGAGGFGFSPTGSAAITRNGNEIEYVALDTANLPAAADTGDVALVTQSNEYVQDSPLNGQPFDVGATTLVKSINTQDGFPTDVAFDNNGTRLYDVGREAAKIFQLSLSTPFDIGTATLEKSLDTQDIRPTGLAFDNNGTRLYESHDFFGNAGVARIYQSSLSTAFDIGSASFTKSIDAQDDNTRGIAFSDDGTRLYEAGTRTDGETISQSNLSTPFDISSASLSKTITSNCDEISGVAFNTDGTRLYEADNRDGGLVFQSSLSTPFDIGTATLSKSIDLPSSSDTSGLRFDNDGERLYYSDDQAEKIFQAQLSGPIWQTI